MSPYRQAEEHLRTVAGCPLRTRSERWGLRIVAGFLGLATLAAGLAAWGLR